MASKSKEVTTSFNVDITNLKKGIQEANRQIRLANAEFKAASSGMENWQKSTDGVSSKITQLDKVLNGQNKILDSYKQQLALIVEEQGENSKGADEMRIKIANQQAAVNKTAAELEKYKGILNDLEAEQKAAENSTEKQANAYDDLKAKISEQESTLESLKKEYANTVIEQGKNSEAADDFAKEIEELSVNLNKNKKALNDAENAADNLDKSFVDVDDSTKTADGSFTVLKGTLADLASKGIQKVVDGLINITKESYNAWQAFDEGFDTVIKKTGASGDAAEDLEDVYEKVSKNIVASYDDIGSAIGEVNTRFGITGNELEILSEKFIKFAQLNDTDVSSSIDSVQSVMAAWGISAKDTGAVLDMLNKAGQDTGTSVDQISNSLVTNGAVLKEMGYSAEDAAFFLANLSKNGIDASSTMAGMKKALANATKEGKPLSDALADVENSIKNAKNSTDAMSIATEIFGAKAAPALTTAIRDGRLSFDELGLSLDDFEGNVEETFENTLDAPDKFKLAIQNLQTEMGKAFNDFFVKYEPQINNALKTFTEDILPKIVNGIGWLIDNLPLISAAITGIVTAMIMFQAVSAIQGIIAAWQAYKAATEGATVAQWLLNAAMEANPIGLLIAAITGLIAAFIYLWNNSEDFRNFWIGLWEKIKEAAIPVIEGLSVAFSAAWEAIKAIVHPWIDYFKATWESIKLIFGVVKDVLSGNFSDAWEKIKEIVSVWADYFRGIWENIKSVFTPVKQFFVDLWNGVKTAASEAWNGIKSVFEPVAEWFEKKFKDAWQKVKDVFSTGGKIFDGIKDGIVSAFKTVVNAIIKGINKVIEIPFNALNKLLNKIRTVEVAGITPFADMWKENPFTVPQIPELEAGGVLKRGQVGLLEGNGAEAVIPLENNKRWINATAKALKGALASEGVIGTGSKVTNNYSFTQNNTSPKALSKLEIYRQTKNQLTLAKGGLA